MVRGRIQAIEQTRLRQQQRPAANRQDQFSDACLIHSISAGLCISFQVPNRLREADRAEASRRGVSAG